MVIGIEVGSTRIKSVLLDEKANILARIASELKINIENNSD